DLYFEPTILDSPPLSERIMKDEIFGPILPIYTYSEEIEINKFVRQFEKPLSFYLFANDKKFVKRINSELSFGGATINDTMVYYMNHYLPFGGVGKSGIGSYHGRHTFETFSHSKSVTYRAVWPDIPLKYAPYNNKTSLLRKLLR
ncbi:MAG: aldehyde dehydrogenase family protein, partial [Candidatus Heimdallarchaeota archaeon]|nr:aldehyde dehydrogenase family protein [Candidatus Heimdallarchaeota archaeon]